MANEVTIPKTFVNAVDYGDADDFNANQVKVNDKVYLSTTAPGSPFVSQIWVKTDEPDMSPLKVRMWLGSAWFAMPLMFIE